MGGGGDLFSAVGKLELARNQWNLQVAVRAAGPRDPSDEAIDGYCRLAGLQRDCVSSAEEIVRRVRAEIAREAQQDASFKDWIAAAVEGLRWAPGTNLGIIELSVEGIAFCRVESTKRGSAGKPTPATTRWADTIPGAPNATDMLRFFLAGGRLEEFPTGQDIVAGLDRWLCNSRTDRERCSRVATWNHLPGWIVPRLLIERLGDRP